ncbi:hypothetical protein C8J56DRAFT_28763 [Mycena floridula]|nr:hypothetical protein C8J56DRAFT_28763 [Mycena floridula]
MSLTTILPFFSILFTTAFAATNRTIDDTLGDSLTGLRPVYFPSTAGAWRDATCSDCYIIPAPALAFAGTWTSCTATEDIPLATAELSFKGTAVYVFLILANDAAHGVTTLTESSFTLDGTLAGNFAHQPIPGLGFQYNQLVFSAQNLPNIDHKLIIAASGRQDHHVFVMLDYAIYTVPDPVIVRTSSSSRASSTTTISSTSSESSSLSTSLILVSHTTSAHTTSAPTSSLIESEVTTSQSIASSSIPENSARLPSLHGTKSKISPGLIAGITLALVIALALGLFLWYRLERRRARTSPLSGAPLMAVDPYIISSRTNPRQIELELQMQEIQRQMSDLQYESGGDSPQSHKSRDRECTEPPPGYSSVSR